MRIRPYVVADWPRLCVVHDAARRDELHATAGAAAFKPLTEAAGPEGLFDHAIDVAELDGRVVAFVAYNDEYLEWLYVDPAHYRRGLGRALVRHFVARATGRTLRISVLTENRAALALYQAEGFVIVAREDGRLAGNDDFAASGYLLERHKA